MDLYISKLDLTTETHTDSLVTIAKKAHQPTCPSADEDVIKISSKCIFR